MGQVLYRKYRSKKLGEVVGQDQVTEALAKALETGKFSHAYLFVGPRGVGKTSVARIFAHAVNDFAYTGENYVDIIEIDAASNTGVDAIRDLIDAVGLVPMVGRKKIYIIDEVHMLSKSAFNALLKTLEEPPEHIMFILATTDAHKIPATILSRVQTLNFRLISPEAAVKHLRFIADQEKIDITDEALMILAEQGGGSFRDSISLLDQVAGIDKSITAESLRKRLGLAGNEAIELLLRSFAAGDLGQIVSTVNKVLDDGAEPGVFASQMIDYVLSNPEYNRPDFLGIVDKLDGVASSAHPRARLIVSLCPETTQPILAESAPLDDISPVLPKTTESSDQPVENLWKSSGKPVEKSENKPVPKKAKEETFSWSKLLDKLDEINATGYRSILAKVKHHENPDGSVEISAKNDFELSKLTSSQFDKIIMELSENGFDVPKLNIHKGNAATGQDNLDAAIQALGGGEVVDKL